MQATSIQQRFKVLAGQFPQAEIARKTGFSRNNVSRYARGKRMPLEFGGALVSGLGVNPSWLLSGAGTPFLADVAADTGRMAGDLLSLVEAMQAVTRMRIGSLAGKQHAKVLRELNDALGRHEALRVKLNAHSRDLFKQLMAEMLAAVRKFDLARARGLETAVEQVSRLCDDPELLLQFLTVRAHLLLISNRKEEALAMYRRAFLMTLSRADNFDEACLTQGWRFAGSLAEADRPAEARQVLRATINLCPPALRQGPMFAASAFNYGYMQAMRPSLHRGLAAMQKHFAAISPDRKSASQLMLVSVQLFGGLVDLPTACTLLPRDKVAANTVLLDACLTLLPRDLEIAIAFTENLPSEESGTQLETYPWARRIHLAVAGKRKQALAELRQVKPTNVENKRQSILYLTLYARAALAASEYAVAGKVVKEALSIIRAHPGMWNSKMALVAMNYATVLQLPKAHTTEAIRKEARQVFSRYIRHGFASFKALLKK
ncbi:MAG: helix-turn-helix transcriptional regulator [Planctomycetes bacterium]|nr:helix-turn-helix transcriptional regulator [Planctomycetota bacterium]